jgi:zinc protease
VTVKRPGQVGVVSIGHKAVRGSDPDYAALTVLDLILTGPRGNGGFTKGQVITKGGAGTTVNNSRLYKALVDRGLAASVQAYARPAHDPSIHTIDATLTASSSHEQVEKIIVDELARIEREGVTDAEVQTAIRQYRAQTAFSRDNSTGIVLALNDWIGSGDWTLYYKVPERVAQVTAADVKRVAAKYLTVDLSTVGWFIPESSGAATTGLPPGKALPPGVTLPPGKKITVQSPK